MRQSNTIGVDLAKNVLQVSVVTPANKELSNKKLSRIKFAEFLARQKPGLIAFEACATAHHWARVATTYGHQVKIIPAIAVAPFRQGHKTDKNDALAVAEAANRPNIRVAPLKSIEQQAMQSIQRSRELIIQERTALSNHLRGLLLEFGIAIPKGLAYLRRYLPLILEDAENGLPMSYRPTLHRMFMKFRALDEDLAFMDEQIKQVVKANDGCRRLLALEGIGPIGAVLLYATLGSGEAFKNGRQFSAYLGLTPKQFSSGGKINIIGISRRVANRRLSSAQSIMLRIIEYLTQNSKTSCAQCSNTKNTARPITGRVFLIQLLRYARTYKNRRRHPWGRDWRLRNLPHAEPCVQTQGH